LQADLAGDDFLERKIDVGRDVADEDNGTAFANCVDRSSDGLVAADTFESDVSSFVVGERSNFREKGIVGDENFGCTEFFCKFETRRINIGDENFGAASSAEGLERENADGACADDKRGGVRLELREIDTVDGDSDGFEHGGFGERKIVGKAIKDSRGDGDEFGESSGAAVVTAGDSEDLATVAKIYVAAAAVGTFAAINGGVEGDAVARREIFYGGADRGDDAGSFVAHDDGRDAAPGGAVVSVNVTAAYAAGGDADDDLVWCWRRRGEIREFEMAVAGEEESFHGVSFQSSVISRRSRVERVRIYH